MSSTTSCAATRWSTSGRWTRAASARCCMPEFDDAFRARLVDLLTWRRDVRRFRGESLPEGLLEHLLEIAALAPSVGLSQPWRFVLVEDPRRRAEVRENFERANTAALAAYEGEEAQAYARLKLAGLA